MRWVRSHIRFGSRLALLALALQIVLSFGHVHLSDVARTSAGAGVTLAGGTGSNAPAHKPIVPVDPGCAICALIQLASTSPPATAPVLLPPTVVGTVALDAPDQAALAAAPPRHFRARAPPIA
jgi:hypothetical protein